MRVVHDAYYMIRIKLNFIVQNNIIWDKKKHVHNILINIQRQTFFH